MLSLIQFYVDYDEFIRLKRFLENRSHFFSSSDGEAFGAKELGQAGKVGDEEIGADHPCGVIFDLVALHPAVGIIAHHYDQNWDVVEAGGGKLLLFHHERAVTGDADNPRVR